MTGKTPRKERAPQPSRTFYRLVKARHADDPFSGIGAETFGGRWNPPGVKAVYFSSSKALATLETVVHAGAELLRQSQFVMLSVEVPEEEIAQLAAPHLPDQWWKYQEQEQTQAIGAAFLDLSQGQVLMLTVPSTLTGEDNAILNPDHPAAAAVLSQAQREPFAIDPRIKQQHP